MSPAINIRQACMLDDEVVGLLTWKLLNELFPSSQEQFDLPTFVRTANNLLSEGQRFWSFLAEIDNQVIGILNLNECVAIYAGGSFGEICELYIEPQHRSASVGAILLDEAKVFARKKGWSCIEVGAPSEENWPRTVGFYLKNGFNVIGPRLEISISAA